MAAPAMDFADYHALVQLYADYAYAVDSGDWNLWPEFFVDDCSYRLVPRENHERGLPLATLAFESKGMLKDRVYGIRRRCSTTRTTSATSSARRWCASVDAERIESEANYAVFRTKLNELEHGVQRRPLPRHRRAHAGGLKFESRLVVYDSEMIPNSIIYPI